MKEGEEDYGSERSRNKSRKWSERRWGRLSEVIEVQIKKGSERSEESEVKKGEEDWRKWKKSK